MKKMMVRSWRNVILVFVAFYSSFLLARWQINPRSYREGGYADPLQLRRFELPAKDVQKDIILAGNLLNGEPALEHPEDPGLEPLSSPDSRPLFVLALSSLPRSGSTLMAEFLGTLPNSVVFFEPMWIKEFTECVDNGACVVEYVHEIFNCTYKEDFEEWLRGKGLFFNYFHEDVRQCRGKEADACKNGIDVRGKCRDATIRAMKIIRARLSFMEPMLKDPDINFKVIYLTRDPRGSLNSIRKFGWDKDPERRCGHLERDQSAFAILSKSYPDKVMHLKQEDFSLSPMIVTQRIISFLFGSPTIPEAVKKFVMRHTSGGNDAKGMNTIRNSTTQYDAWRYDIQQEQLEAIEAEPVCVRTIQRMGHRLFGSIERTQNSSISLII